METFPLIVVLTVLPVLLGPSAFLCAAHCIDTPRVDELVADTKCTKALWR
jgi:hypothetical protein